MSRAPYNKERKKETYQGLETCRKPLLLSLCVAWWWWPFVVAHKNNQCLLGLFLLFSVAAIVVVSCVSVGVWWCGVGVGGQSLSSWYVV